jgi:hypothetical protein
MSQVSFAADIKPLFRAIDISHMGRYGIPLGRSLLLVAKAARPEILHDMPLRLVRRDVLRFVAVTRRFVALNQLLAFLFYDHFCF